MQKVPNTVGEVLDLASRPDWTQSSVEALQEATRSTDERVKLAAIMAVWRLDIGKPIDRADFALLMEDA